jgi:large subunit ribosomal protein L29
MKNTFKNLTFAELKVKRSELARKYMDLRFQMVIGHVDNPLQKRVLRRQIACVNTLIRAHEMREHEMREPGSDKQAASKNKKA